MHILFLTDNFTPEVNAPASRTYEHSKEWVKLGQSVTVITCAPNFPTGRVYQGYKNKIWQTEIIDGIKVIRVWTYMTGNEGFSKRIIDYMSFMLSSFLAAFFVRKIDIVVGTSPQFFTTVSAWAVAGLKRRPFIFELRDLWPESIRAVGVMNQARVLDFLEKLELFLYRRADYIVTVTNSFKANLVGRGIDPSKIAVVTNGVDGSKFKPQIKDQCLVRDLGLNEKFVVGYIGTHGLAHALETLLKSASILSTTPNVHFLFIGDGALKNKLMKEAHNLKLINVSFLKSVPKSQVLRYWSLLDVSVVHLRKTDLFKSVIPSKIFESMGMAIPIIHGVEGESAEIIYKNKVGLLFEPENPSDLADKILRLRQDSRLLKRLSKNGNTVAKQYDRTKLARDMLDCLQTFIN